MFDLNQMRESDWAECRRALSQMSSPAESMEEVAGNIVCYLYDHLRDGNDGPRACALVRLFKTHAYGGLPVSLQETVDQAMGDEVVGAKMKCLTLLASAGDEPAWNRRRESQGHQVIPLIRPDLLARLPMVARLVEQFGLAPGDLLAPDPSFILDQQDKQYNAFHVTRALGSPYIPAQETFVRPHGIQSVIGFGSMLPSGDLCAVLLFTRVPVSRTTAAGFSLLSLSVKISLLHFVFRRIFA